MSVTQADFQQPVVGTMSSCKLLQKYKHIFVDLILLNIFILCIFQRFKRQLKPQPAWGPADDPQRREYIESVLSSESTYYVSCHLEDIQTNAETQSMP